MWLSFHVHAICQSWYALLCNQRLLINAHLMVVNIHLNLSPMLRYTQADALALAYLDTFHKHLEGATPQVNKVDPAN